MRANTDWFKEAKWVVSNHFLADCPVDARPQNVTPASWNERVNNYDAAALADPGLRPLPPPRHNAFYCSWHGSR